ncbi:fimbria/pilus outer membrane usher protein, partial [Serratia fonticola]
TGYSGVIGSNYYQSVSAGLALNTGIGAISSDITQSRSQLSNNESTQGQSIRLTYAKILPVIDTNITLASYQYSSSGYYGMD